MASVERLTGVAIELLHVDHVHIVRALIDALGGVTVDVPKNVTVPDPMTAENVSLKAGRSQSLDGSEASSSLVRARSTASIKRPSVR